VRVRKRERESREVPLVKVHENTALSWYLHVKKRREMRKRV